jgi:hypothetical protein
MFVTTEICSEVIPYAEGPGGLAFICYATGAIATLFGTFAFGLVCLLRNVDLHQNALFRSIIAFACGFVLLGVFDVCEALGVSAAFAVLGLVWGFVTPWLMGLIAARRY